MKRCIFVSNNKAVEMSEERKRKLSKDLKEDGYKIVKHNEFCTVLKKGNITIKLK